MFIVLGVLWILECIHFFNHSNSCEKHGDMAPEIFFRLVTDRVSGERKLSRKNAKIFDRILQTFMRNFTFFSQNELCEKMRKQCEISRKQFSRNFAKNNFAKEKIQQNHNCCSCNN